MRIAACQMVSGTNIDENIHTAKSLIDSAAQSGAELVVLPEYFSLMPASDKDWVAAAETFGDGPVQKAMSQAAKEHCLQPKRRSGRPLRQNSSLPVRTRRRAL